MTDFSPKGYLIRYPFLIDRCICRLVDDFQDSFALNKEKDKYVLKKKLSKKDLSALLSTYLNEEIARILSKAYRGTLSPISDWYIVADSGSERRACFTMKEKDIDISLHTKLENIFILLFNKRMKEKCYNHHMIYCKHKMLLSDDWEKICRKKVFGRSNFTLLDAHEKMRCVIEEKKEISEELSKENSSLIVSECAEFLKQKMRERCS